MNRNVRYLVFLAIGVLLAVLFLLFPAQIYEGIRYFNGGYSNEMYNYGVYDTFALIMLLVTWIMAVVYYYVINSVRFDRWPHWLIMLVVSMAVAPGVCFGYNEYVFAENGLSYLSESMQMVFVNVLMAAVWYVVASFSIRWWSSNCRHSPF